MHGDWLRAGFSEDFNPTVGILTWITVTEVSQYLTDPILTFRPNTAKNKA